MVNNIVFMSNEGLLYFKTNFDNYLELYKELNVDEINQELVSKGFINKTDLLFKFEPLLHEGNSDLPNNEMFLLNIKNIYGNLSNINLYQALNEGFWCSMYHTYYADHLTNYITSNYNKKSINENIKSSVLFMHGTKRSLIVNNLSRYWWLGYYLIDEANKENPYHILEFYTSTGDITGKSMITFSSNLLNNKEVLFGVLLGIKKSIELGYIKNSRSHYVEIIKELNITSATTILDLYTRDEIIRKTCNYFNSNYGSTRSAEK